MYPPNTYSFRPQRHRETQVRRTGDARCGYSMYKLCRVRLNAKAVEGDRTLSVHLVNTRNASTGLKLIQKSALGWKLSCRFSTVGVAVSELMRWTAFDSPPSPDLPSGTGPGY